MLNKSIQRLKILIFLKIVSFTIIFIILNDLIANTNENLEFAQKALENARTSLSQLQSKLHCLKNNVDQFDLAQQEYNKIINSNFQNYDPLDILKNNSLTQKMNIDTTSQQCANSVWQNQPKTLWFDVIHSCYNISFTDLNMLEFLKNLPQLYTNINGYKTINSIKLWQNPILNGDDMTNQTGLEVAMLHGIIGLETSYIHPINHKN